MGTFYTGCRVENHTDRTKNFRLPKLLVDTGSEYTSLPTGKLVAVGVRREKKDLRFVMANGQVITRSVGFAVLRVDKHFTIDEVVFAEPAARANDQERGHIPKKIVVDEKGALVEVILPWSVFCEMAQPMVREWQGYYR